MKDDWLRGYFVENHLMRYVSEGTKLITGIESSFEKDAWILRVIVQRADGQSIELSTEIKSRDRWPAVSDEFIAQLMMVG